MTDKSIGFMNSSEFDRRFDDGESIIVAVDVTAARRQRLKQKHVNVDFPLRWWSNPTKRSIDWE